MGAGTMVVVAGAMHGAWVWDRVTPILAAAGWRVVAEDLPGMGRRRGADADAVTLDDWGDFVADLARAVPAPVVLAGHSRGGLVIGEAAERAPEAIAGLIYVAAMIARPGETGMEAGRDPGRAPPQPAPVPQTAMLPTPAARDLFYNLCSKADAAAALARLEPEPPRPLHTPASVSWARWGRLPRGYVECRHDNTLSLARQRRFQTQAPCDPVVTLDTDHSPFLSAPGALAAAMLRMGAAFTAS